MSNNALKKNPLPLIGAVGLTIGAGLVLWHIDPNASNSLLPACPIYSLTGLLCPGCGSTRCLYALAHGDLVQALRMNPLLVLSLPALGLMLFNASGYQLVWLNPLIRILANPKLWLVVLLSYTLLRNLPWFPFTLLAPY